MRRDFTSAADVIQFFLICKRMTIIAAQLVATLMASSVQCVLVR